MNLSTIELDRPKAIQAFRIYREAVKVRHFAEDEMLLKGYRELARGRRLISLNQALETSGVMDVEHHQYDGTVRIIKAPKLAICPADARRCILEISWNGGGRYFADRVRRLREGSGMIGDGWVRLPTGILPERKSRPNLETVVPLAPVGLRPARGLAGYHVLWEVEKWQVKPVPPGDPALLKYIGGDLWAVIAVWDLSQMEKLVLMGR